MDIPANTIQIIGALAAVFCIGFLFLRIGRGGRTGKAAQASHAFRKKVLAELEGLYPVTRSWDSDAFRRFKETVPGIEAASAEFRAFVPSEKKSAFDEAVKAYCEHCSEITWQACATFGIIPETSRPEDIGPKEIFRQNVNALLSFAKER